MKFRTMVLISGMRNGIMSPSTGDWEMSERAKVAEFVSFCIEMFAKAKRLSGDKVAAVFQSCGAIDYLDSGYDVLHTQGERWLVSDLDEFLRIRGVSA